MVAALTAGTRRSTEVGRHPVSLLDLDGGLGALLPPDREAKARERLRVVVHRLHVGVWDVSRLSTADPGHLGLLVIDGMPARRVFLQDHGSLELVGAGDLVRLWHIDADGGLLRYDVRWSVLADTRLAVLDRKLAIELACFPEVHAALLDRVDRRMERLAVARAIAHLNGVDRRLLALFWHLAERWGRMTTAGVVIPLTLSHRVLGDLGGAWWRPANRIRTCRHERPTAARQDPIGSVRFRRERPPRPRVRHAEQQRPHRRSPGPHG